MGVGAGVGGFEGLAGQSQSPARCSMRNSHSGLLSLRSSDSCVSTVYYESEVPTGSWISCLVCLDKGRTRPGIGTAAVSCASRNRHDGTNELWKFRR